MATIALRYRATQIFVSVESVCGSTEIERVSRIPGAASGVKGLVLFRGEPVPLLSFFGGSAERSPHQRMTHSGKTDDFAVILSVSGVMFAARVDELPRMCADSAALGKIEGKTCYMRRRHLEQLLGIYVGKTKEDSAAAVDHNRTAQDHLVVENIRAAQHDQAKENNQAVEHNESTEHDDDTEPETDLVAEELRCAT